MIKNSRFQAFGLAVIIEFILLAGGAIALANSESSKPALSGTSIITLATEEPQPPKPPEPKIKPQPKPKPLPVLTPPQIVPEEPKPVLPQVAEAQANAFTEPAPPVPAPVPVIGPAEPSAEYAAKVHAAVQAAHYYPPAAISLHFSGRVRVEFHLRDVTVSEIRVLVASGIGLIDRAALQAVQNAKYPLPPPEIQGADHVYQVWVEFNRQ